MGQASSRSPSRQAQAQPSLGPATRPLRRFHWPRGAARVWEPALTARWLPLPPGAALGQPWPGMPSGHAVPCASCLRRGSLWSTEQVGTRSPVPWQGVGRGVGEGREDEGGWVWGTQRQERWGEGGLQARGWGGAGPTSLDFPHDPPGVGGWAPCPRAHLHGKRRQPVWPRGGDPNRRSSQLGPLPSVAASPWGMEAGALTLGDSPLRSTAPPSPGGPRGRPRSLLRSWAVLPGPRWPHSLGSPTVCIVKPTSDRSIPGFQCCN